MSQHKNRARGLALALFASVGLTAIGGTANAQLAPDSSGGGMSSNGCPAGVTAPGGCGTNTPASSPSTSAGDTLEGQYLLLAHDLDGYHPCHQGDTACRRVRASAYQTYVAAHPNAGMLSMTDVLTDNRNMCRTVGAGVREKLDIAIEIYNPNTREGMGPELDGIRGDLRNLGVQQAKATTGRRGAELGSAILSWLFGPIYGGMNTLGQAGNEMVGSAHDKGDKINRHQSDLNARQSQLQLRAMLVSSSDGIAWAVMVQPICLQDFSDATLGAPGSAAPQGWGYWNDRTNTTAAAADPRDDPDYQEWLRHHHH